MMSTLVIKGPRGNAAGRLLRAAASRVGVLFNAWKNRRAVADLLACDDRMLADIGVTRGDVLSSLSLPLDRDPSRRLVVLSVERRAARAAIRRQVRDLAQSRGDS